ncbi:MAG: DUF975 family protein [Lachnospiraceae bacterium]|nr:DUF975 family protein [Lachnospiraceae bacterium]
MWTRSELKKKGIERLKNNYLMCFLVALIYNYFATNSSGIKVDVNQILKESNNNMSIVLDHLFDTLLPDSLSRLMSHFNHMGREVVGFLILFCGILLTIFVFNMIEVGARRFFVKNLDHKPGAGEMIEVFRDKHYMDNVKTMLMKMVYQFLWTLLLFIPGIVKGYEYRMIPYILAEHPETSEKEAFRRSKELMNGEKMNAFIFDLSFFGWYLLAAVTLNIAGILFVSPYKCCADAQLYEALKETKGIY